MEKVLQYPRDQVGQDTFYNCGPASCQTVIRAATGSLIAESELGRCLRTHRGGTDWIGQFPTVLNHFIPAAHYRHREMPNDPPTAAQRDRLWEDIVGSIDRGHGVVANIVAPPSNYPRAVAPSTIQPIYKGGTVYHYFAVMGYSDQGQRRVWIADSGFYPGGYWLALDQLATLIPPKGYAYSGGA
ncbi:C39 family peptidase [Corynebacterium striatum]|nr:C39 family peptidase [Corynebacterium striatum]